MEEIEKIFDRLEEDNTAPIMDDEDLASISSRLTGRIDYDIIEPYRAEEHARLYIPETEIQQFSSLGEVYNR